MLYISIRRGVKGGHLTFTFLYFPGNYHHTPGHNFIMDSLEHLFPGDEAQYWTEGSSIPIFPQFTPVDDGSVTGIGQQQVKPLHPLFLRR